MVLQNQKLDITDRIVGKLKNGAIELFADNEQIGRIVLPPNGSTFELKEGYEQQQDKVYKQVTITTNPDQKYVDCDSESGWC
ncbi:YusG family protein [Anoxybacteroides tepidamans]|uniref:YusG family protein n=1 Tax=Anoxybacteroides tepidamans TaxID=265948 RepID=UPI00048721CF|nr:YusG family protein [Anoxybacillus tepidamans]